MTEFLNALAKQAGFDTFSSLVIQIGWNLGEAALIILFGWLALRFLVGQVVKALERLQFPDPTVRGVIALLLRWAIILFTAYYVMLAVGVEATAIFAVITGSALAIGLAMQGTLSNVASGMMLLILRPISVGDYIRGGGHAGTVVTLGIFYTTIDTIEKFRISIPNSALFGSAIVNLTRNPIQTGRLKLGVSYEADLDQVKELLIASTKSIPEVLPDPEPRVLIQDLGDSAILLEVWFDAKQPDVWEALRKARQAAKATLDANGIEIPFPQTTVHYRSNDKS